MVSRGKVKGKMLTGNHADCGTRNNKKTKRYTAKRLRQHLKKETE